MTQDEAIKVLREALDSASDLAGAEAYRVHETYAGYKPDKHRAVDADVELMNQASVALEVLRAQLAARIEPATEMLDMLGRDHPYAQPYNGDEFRRRAYERLNRASDIQQPLPVPDQAAIVWRADLMAIIADLTHKQAFFECYRAPPQIAQPAPSLPDGWISVEDRLPEIGQGVIAYRPTAQQTSDPTICVTFYRGRGFEREDWQGVVHGFDCLCHPSHWMPLPAAPKNDGGA